MHSAQSTLGAFLPALLTNGAIRLGPLLLPLPLLLVFLSVAATLVVGNRLARRAGVEIEPTLWRALAAAAVVARLAFVVEYASFYLAAPLTVLDIRDGGWNPLAGLLGAWLYALVVEWKRPAIARPAQWALATGSVVLAVGLGAAALAPSPGLPLPRDLALASLDGAAVPLGRFAGKPVVVNLWATWCGPCVREMPVLRAAQLARPDVQFVFINQGEDPAIVRGWLAARGLSLQNVLIDERQRASAAFEAKGYPTTLFFDAAGTLTSRRVGEVSAATLAQRLPSISR